MSPTERTIVENGNGYKEVSLEFRTARARALEEKQVGTKTDRIVCPVLDASRRDDTPYGKAPLAGCTSKALEDWAGPLDIPATATKVIAYMSGPFTQFPSNMFHGTFDDHQVNTGFIRGCKHSVHTGILSKGYFDQDVFNEFVWALYPDLMEQKDDKGNPIPIDNAYLYSSKGADLYLGLHNVASALVHNEKQSPVQHKFLGPKMSRDEMVELLIGRLGQEVKGLGGTTAATAADETVKAISIRDVHDLYKYGLFPAFMEDRFLDAGLVEPNCVALTSQS